MEFAGRLDGLEEYFLAKTMRKINGREKGDIINLAVGNPDLEPPRAVINGLTKAAVKKFSNGYQPSIGSETFRIKAVEWYSNKLGVKLDYKKEVISLIGSKEGIFHISLAMLNPGDKILAPDPGYPVYGLCAKLLGAKTVKYNLNKGNDWQIDIEELKSKCKGKVKILWLNSPHMPTGSRLTNKNLQAVIKFAKAENILVVHDNPYSFILNKQKPASILSLPGAMENVIEFCSLSKTFNIPGFRIAIAAGNEDVLNAIAKTKSIIDSGSYLPLQMGAVNAFSLGNEWFAKLNKIYAKRKELIIEMASVLGCSVEKNSSGLFVWGKLPCGIDDMKFTEKLLSEQKILVTPGSVYGRNGKGYIRISLCQPEEKIKSAISRIKNIERG